MKKKRPLNNHQKIVNRFVTIEFSSQTRGFWPHQIKIAGQLIKKYGLDFLLWVTPPENYRIQSLVFFLTPIGKNYFSSQLVEYKKLQTFLPKKQEINLSDCKIGQDIIIEKKPKSIKEFLNYG